ncbi:MAG: thioredoxin-related protein [Saprospiraceae bacterium]|jgi:thioredoxin-related protein
MKTTAVSLLLLISSYIGTAQEIIYHINDAQQIAIENDQSIMMVFSGSDWCKPCIQLKKEVLEKKEFQSFRKEHLVHLELDFPYSKKNTLTKEQLAHNETLAEKYNQAGSFPKVIFLDQELNTLGEVQYSKGMDPKEFVQHVQKIIQI